MTDHEPFILLAARQLHEALPDDEREALDAHLAECPACRAIAAGMRRDDMLVRGELGSTAVAPRVRRRVLDEAKGRRRVDARLVLALAAALALAMIGVPMLVGGRLVQQPPPPVPSESPVAERPSPSPSPSAIVPSPVPSQQASPSGPQAFVAGAYTYGPNESRRDTLAAHFENGPVGEWSRRVPATGEGDTYAGTVTCLEIEGSDAWLAGPVTVASDGSTGGAVLIHVHDGGPNGEGDAVILWMGTEGQTLATMTSWCENHFIPGGPFPLTSGDVVVQDDRP